MVVGNVTEAQQVNQLRTSVQPFRIVLTNTFGSFSLEASFVLIFWGRF